MTTHPCAKNARYARAYGFDGLLVPSGLVMLIAFSQTVEDVSENARTNLEYIDMRFGAPVYVRFMGLPKGGSASNRSPTLNPRPVIPKPPWPTVSAPRASRGDVSSRT